MSSPSQDYDPGQSAWLRWRQVGLVAAVLLTLAFVLYLARGALFPFIIAVILAELLHPVVAFLESRLPGHERFPGVTRIFAILVIYLVFAAVVAGILYVTLPPLFREAQDFIEAVPQLYERARTSVEGWSDQYVDRVPPELRTEIEEAIQAGGNVLATAAAGILRRTISGVSNAVTLVIGLAIVPFFLFYLLKDREDALDGLYSLLSPHNRRHAREIINRVNNVIGAYVRAQLLSATIVGVAVFIGLAILDIRFAAILGLFAGLFGLIPIIGTVLGAVPGILVTLASAPEKLIWVALVYIVVQLVESNVISPRIHGNAVRLHPALIMVILVVASETAGLWGVVVGVPLVAAVRDVFLYFYHEWDKKDAVEEEAPETLGIEGPARQQNGPQAPTSDAAPLEE